MFKKLRNKFILTNIITTTVIILVSFTAVFIFTKQAEEKREMFTENSPTFIPMLENIIIDRLDMDRGKNLDNLFVTMFWIGVTMEIIVAIASYFLAEKYIEPVKKSYDSQKTFIANASHEIKTPIAAIEANLEALDIKDNHWIDNIKKEADKISNLNSELLTLAKSDCITEKKKEEETELKSFIINILSTKEILLGEKILKFSGENFTQKINREDLAKILDILLDNAIKYSEKNLSIKQTEHTVIISNDGAKIKEEDLDKVFDRFYQADKSSEGVGLGLSIAKSICDRNNWKLLAKSNENTTSFELVL